MNDEYYGWMGINEGWFSDALKNYKNIETLKKQWKAAADKFVSHHHIQRFITPQQEEMCKKYYDILKREDVSYAEYKKAFNFMCKFMGLGNKDLIIEHIEFENDSRDKEKRVIKLSYSRGRIEIEIPEGVSLIHISPIKGITALEPSFRNKKFGSFMYPSKRVFFTLSKDIPKSKASLSDATIHRYVARDRIKKAFIDPSCNSFGMRAVYVETDKPIAVESYHTFLERILNKVGQFFTFSGHKSKHEQAYIEMCEQPVLFKESEDLLALQASKEYIRKIWPEIKRVLDACKLKYPDLATLFYICSTSDIESSLLDYGIERRSIPIIFFNKNALITKFGDNLNPVYYGKEPFDIPKPHDEIVAHGNAFIKEFTTTIERLGYGLIVYNHKLYAADAIYFMPYGPKFKAFIKDYMKQQPFTESAGVEFFTEDSNSRPKGVNIAELIHSSQTLNDFMKREIKYDDEDKSTGRWRLKDPNYVKSYRIGDCHDQAYFAKYWLDKQGYETQLYFAIEFKGDQIYDAGKTHTWVAYKDKDGWYWFENAWANEAGIHGPFKTEQDMIVKVYSVWPRDEKYDKLFVDKAPVQKPDVNFETFVKTSLGKSFNKLDWSKVLNDSQIDKDINLQSIQESTTNESSSISIDGVYDSFLEDCIDLEAIDEFSLSELWDHLNNWQTHNQNQSKQEFISNHVSKKDFEEIKDCIKHLKEEDDYHEYKKYFNRLCALCHIAPTGTVIYSYIYTANEKDPENNFVRVVYTYNIKKIDMPEDAMFYHMTKVKHLHELKPTFRSKSFTKLGGNRQYFYSSPRVYLTLNKTMLKWFADYSFSDEVETYVVNDKTIKQAYVDPLVPGSISRAIYIETDKPIKVITLEEWQKREALRGVKFQRKDNDDDKKERTKHAHEALIDFALNNSIAPITEGSIEDYIDDDMDVYGDMVARQQVHIIQNLNDVIRYDTSSNKPEEIDEKIDLIKKIYSPEIAYLWRCIFNLQVRSKLFSRFMSFFVIPRIGLFNSDERIIVDKFLEFTKAIDRVALAVDLYECGDIEEWQLSKIMNDITYVIDTVSQDVILYDEQIKDEIIQTCIEEHVNSYNIKNN